MTRMSGMPYIRHKIKPSPDPASPPRWKGEDSRVFPVRRTAALTVLLLALACPTVGLPSATAATAPAWPHRGPWHSRYETPRRANAEHPLRDALPNPRLTPGALNPAVTQDDIHETICVWGYSRTIRPPEAYTERLKREQIREYGYRDRWLRDYEEDHLIALSLGGSSTSPENLWPQPHDVVGGWGSYAKDRLQGRLHWLVCHRGLRLATAQRALAHDWIAAYQRYIGRVPNNHRLHWNGG